MSDNTTQLGTIKRSEIGLTGTLERCFSHPVEEVWKHLTAPHAMAEWLAPGSIELKPDGKVHIDFADSGIVIESSLRDYVYMHVLEYSWSHGSEPERPLRWQLASKGKKTTLTLSVSVPKDEDIAKACAGFAAHMEMLAAVLEGVSIKFPFDVYSQAREVFNQQVEVL